MVLSAEQKAYLIFKELTGFSDEDLLIQYVPDDHVGDEQFDSFREDGSNDQTSPRHSEEIDQNSVNPSAVKASADEIRALQEKLKGTQELEDDKKRVIFMFQSKSKVSQEGFNNVMKGMLARELETDKGRAFAVVDLLCKDCRPRCTYPCAWLFVKFCELELKDYSEMLYKKNDNSLEN